MFDRLMFDFDPLEVVGRDSEAQLQVVSSNLQSYYKKYDNENTIFREAMPEGGGCFWID